MADFSGLRIKVYAPGNIPVKIPVDCDVVIHENRDGGVVIRVSGSMTSDAFDALYEHIRKVFFDMRASNFSIRYERRQFEIWYQELEEVKKLLFG